MEIVRLACLGPVSITRGEHPVSGFRSAKALALLCYLAITGQPHTRPALAGLLWGELPEDDARRNLRTVVANLRQLVGAQLVVTRDTLAFDRSAPYWLDVEDFERAAAAPAAPDLAQLQATAALIRGELLQGLFVRDAPDWDDWLTGQRERLRQLSLQALHRLASQALAEGDYTAGIDAATRLLAMEPWQEDGHRLVMRLLALDGRPDAALAQYARCVALLHRDLGAEPAMETTILADHIRAGALEPQPAPSRARHNLPTQRLPLLGRAADVDAVNELLLRPDVGVVTLVGPGGVGKTRLALEVAAAVVASFSDGVLLVNLAPITDAALVLPTIAQVLDVKVDAQQSTLASLTAALRARCLLLVLDNLEQLLAATPPLGELLAAAPAVKVLATSRVRLPLYGATTYAVAPLALPPAPVAAATLTAAALDALARIPTVQLFVERAQAADRSFALTNLNAAAVVDICRHLDGLPLAIELAAARVGVFPPPLMVTRLENRFGLLGDGPADRPARQRTLRATLDWSYALLAPAVQAVLQRLAVFVGGWTLALAEAVVADAVAPTEGVGRDAVADVLGTLVASSLVQRLANPASASATAVSDVRYGMLETIRAYALEQLERSGEHTALRQRHLEAYLVFAEAAGLQRRVHAPAEVLAQLEGEHDNVRAALRWAQASGQHEALLRLGSALGAFWLATANQREGRQWLEQGLAACDTQRPPSTTAQMRARLQAGRLAAWQADYAAAQAHLERSLALAQASDDGPMIAWTLFERGALAFAQADYAGAQQPLGDSLARARALGDGLLTMHAGGQLGINAAFTGRAAEAIPLLEASLVLVEQHADERFRCRVLLSLSLSHLQLGELARAERLAGEALLRLQGIGDRWFVVYAFVGLALIAAKRGQARRGTCLLGVADHLQTQNGVTFMAGIQALYAGTRTLLEAQLEHDAFARAWTEGTRLSMEDATAMGLDNR